MGRFSIAEQTFSILLTTFIVLMSSAVEPSVCSTSCNVNVKYNDSTLYALNVTTQNSFTLIVEVYSKICSENLDEVGPSWYRLEVINSTTKDLGSFKTQFLAEYSGATLSEDQEIEFDGGEEPLALFDLPRRYAWESDADYLPPKTCFRMVIRHGGICEQVVTANCKEELHQYLEENSEFGSGSELTTETPHTDPALGHKDLEHTPPSLEIQVKIMQCILYHPKLNCTGNRVKATCGTDHQWYRNVCTLRLYRCVYIYVLDDFLQRDREEKHCTHPAPDPSSFSPFIPTPPIQPPTESVFTPCVENNQEIADAGGIVVTKCLTYQLYKPIACWKQGNHIQCSCINSRSGSVFGTNWVIGCNSESTSPPQGLLSSRPFRYCGLQ